MPEPSTARVFAALRRFGAPLFGTTLEDLSTPGMVLQIGVVPVRIDLLTAISGVDFDEAWQRRVEVEIEGLRIPCISRADYIKNKGAPRTSRTRTSSIPERPRPEYQAKPAFFGVTRIVVVAAARRLSSLWRRR